MKEEKRHRKDSDNKKDRMTEAFLTVREVAELLHVHSNTARRWSDLGLIKSYRVGPRGDRRFKAEDLNNFVTTVKSSLGGATLVVDDDPDIQELLKDIVLKHGHEVTVVDSGEEALEALDNQRFDLVFLDLVLPHLSGVEVLRAIKDRDKKTIVAVITGFGDDPQALEAMAMGPMFFIRKPFDVSEITAVVDLIIPANQ
jgi:two-component system response regulator (stage 0 sporulation protein F)